MRRYIVSMAFALLLAVNCMALASDNKSEDAKSLSIPVYFITDRDVIQDKSGKIEFGSQRQYLGICKHDAHMGLIPWVVENNRDKSISAHEKDLGWASASVGTNSQDKFDLVKGNSHEVEENSFYSTLGKQAARTADNELYVFVPGYASTLESGLRSAARFAYYSERPVVLYSWPSYGTLRGYPSDESSIEWSQDHFDHFIQQLTALSKKSGNNLKVRLFAHSMGTRLVLKAVPLLRENPAFSEITLVCPDIDDGLFQHYVSKFAQGAKGSTTIRLYLSKKDKMLAVSKKIHGGYARLGQTSLSDAQGRVSGAPGKDDEVEITTDLRKGQHRFQTVDVSDLDRGVLGHRIPVELVCSLSQTGRPSSKYKLVASQSQIKRAGDSPVNANVSANAAGTEHESAADAILKSNYLWAVPVVEPKHRILSAAKEKLPTKNLFKGKDWTLP